MFWRSEAPARGMDSHQMCTDGWRRKLCLSAVTSLAFVLVGSLGGCGVGLTDRQPGEDLSLVLATYSARRIAAGSEDADMVLCLLNEGESPVCVDTRLLSPVTSTVEFRDSSGHNVPMYSPAQLWRPSKESLVVVQPGLACAIRFSLSELTARRLTNGPYTVACLYDNISSAPYTGAHGYPRSWGVTRLCLRSNRLEVNTTHPCGLGDSQSCVMHNASAFTPGDTVLSWTNGLSSARSGAGAGVAIPGITNVAVYIVGAVTQEGWHHLPASSSMKDAIEAAGGTRPYAAWLGTVVLARRTQNGRQIERHRVHRTQWAGFRLENGDLMYVLEGR